VGIISKLLARAGYVKKRGYDAGSVGRLLSDWLISSKSANEEIKASLSRMRARSRELAINNDYAKRFLSLLIINVVGPMSGGIKLQNKARDISGNLDVYANDSIEKAWKEWGKRKNASADGRLSWLDIQKLVLKTVARDGEIIIRKVNYFTGNDFRFALQFFEADHLDENLNKTNLPNGNQIRMGIEIDSWGKAVAYHLKTKHPGETSMAVGSKMHQRISAEEIIHPFITDRPGQLRGVPWMHSAMARMNMLGAYEEAELVASRISASKMGFYKTPTGDEYKGDGKDSDGNLIAEVEPGIFEQLPAGVEVQTFDPQHPGGNFDPFMKTVLRGIAAGLDTSYNALTGDLESANYSSLRQGSLSDRDGWRVTQRWLIEQLHREVFEGWLKMALLTQIVPLPVRKFDKFNAPHWQPRGWSWVDPKKEADATDIGLTNQTRTRASVYAEQGTDIEEMFEEIKYEKQLAKAHGIDLTTAKNAGKAQIEVQSE